MKWAFWRFLEALRDSQEAVRGILARLDALETAPRPTTDLEPVTTTLEALQGDILEMLKHLNAHSDALEALQRQAKDFTFALSEGIERTDRAERRIAATVKRARDKLAESGFSDAGLDAEADGLQLVDGDRSEDVRVQGVPAEVAAVASDASSVKGVPLATMRRLRGM